MLQPISKKKKKTTQINEFKGECSSSSSSLARFYLLVVVLPLLSTMVPGPPLAVVSVLAGVVPVWQTSRHSSIFCLPILTICLGYMPIHVRSARVLNGVAALEKKQKNHHGNKNKEKNKKITKITKKTTNA